MRGVLIGVLTALGIGFVGTSGALAAPINGAVVGRLATTQSPLAGVRLHSRRFCVVYHAIPVHSWRSHRLIRRVCIRWRHI